jgi:hypothetical protein
LLYENHRPSTITGAEKAALQAALNTLDVWLIVFGVLVAIGAVGRSVAGYLHWRKSGELQTVLEAENLAQQQEIAKANATAAQAQQRAAEANLELARMKAPRTLRAEPVVSILKPFAGTSFDVGLVQGDAEAADFMLVLEGVLKAAGWREVDWAGGDIVMTREGSPTAGLVTTRNVAVGVHPARALTLGNAAAALADALNAQGIVARRGTTDAGFINKNADAVHILIGRKT